MGEKRTTFAKAYGIKVRRFDPFAFPSPQTGKKKSCMESPLSNVQVEIEQWTTHSPHQTQLKKRPPSCPHPHATIQLLIGCMEILTLKLVATISGLD
jgi:hypothetical protein